MKNKILIVEDNFVNRSILKKMLLDEYDVQEAENGAKALDIIKRDYKELSAIILDLIMPVMDGRELLNILIHSEKYSNIPVLIATGEHNQELERECLQIGAWDFVTKPYDPFILKLRLENIIGRSQTYLLQKIRVLAERSAD